MGPGLTSRRRAALLLVLVALVVNLPLAHGAWLGWRLDRSGLATEAEVTDTAILAPADDPTYVVEFVFTSDVDPAQQTWSAQLDAAAYDEAVDAETVEVRVLPDAPAVHRVVGQTSSRLALVVTLVTDALLGAALLLVWRFGRRRGAEDPKLRLVAIADVERCRPGTGVERLEDGSYVVRGEVCAIGADAIVLDVGDQTVHVELAGHANPVGYQQPAVVTGRLHHRE